jgi:membrane protease YdiL (CAAX protease family)
MMTAIQSIVRKLIGFFGLTFLVSWTCFFGAAMAVPPGNSLTAGVAGAIYLVGVFAPALVAILLTTAVEGRDATVALLRRVVQVPTRAPSYLFALGFMAIAKLAAAAIFRIVTATWPEFGDTPWYVLILAIPLSTPVQAGEELGWRGYALPRLAAQMGLGRASVLLGAIWGFWHLPFFFMSGVDKTGQSLPVYVLGTMAISVAMGWLYWRTHGSVLSTMIMHAAVNNTTEIVPTRLEGATNPWSWQASMIGWLTLGTMWIMSAWCLTRMRHSSLAPSGGREQARVQ